ncbi:hypothetical protein GCM10023313_32230 [Mucilaginibacter defluvii]|uniref:Uncharacterized protein n=1 Tax=Mucilaginibacter defluvii TaxID=1196019 RepID=A0ABP9G0W1_9SPHI
MNKAETARRLAQQTIGQEQSTTIGNPQQPSAMDTALNDFLQTIKELTEKTAITQPLLREIIQRQETIERELKKSKANHRVLIYIIVLTAILNLIGWILL